VAALCSSSSDVASLSLGTVKCGGWGFGQTQQLRCLLLQHLIDSWVQLPPSCSQAMCCCAEASHSLVPKAVARAGAGAESQLLRQVQLLKSCPPFCSCPALLQYAAGDDIHVQPAAPAACLYLPSPALSPAAAWVPLYCTLLTAVVGHLLCLLAKCFWTIAPWGFAAWKFAAWGFADFGFAASVFVALGSVAWGFAALLGRGYACVRCDV
jgi:hypothetical protein